MTLTRQPFDDAWRQLEVAENAGYPRNFLAPFEAAAARGDLGALAVLTSVHEAGIRVGKRWIVRKNERMANRYLVRSGEPEAMSALAGQLSGSTKTRERAIQLYKRAFRKGYNTAAENLAITYKRHGELALAVTWFRRAAAEDETALYEVAVAELNGAGTRRNPTAAFAKLRRIAKSSAWFHPTSWLQIQAMLTMARALDEGWLVRQDTAAAMGWLKRAAALGSTRAKAEISGH